MIASNTNLRQGQPFGPVALGLVILLVLGAWVLMPGAASAHAELTGSSPGNGAEVSTPPESVELTFSEPVVESRTTVEVTDRDGRELVTGEPEVSGSTVSVALPENHVEQYTVAYQTVGADGHSISGEIWFTVAGAAPSSHSPTPSPSPTPAPSAESEASGGEDSWWLVAGLVGVGALGAAGFLVLGRRRVSRPGGPLADD